MKHRSSLLALLLTAAAAGGGCRSAQEAQRVADPAHVFVRASEIAGVDWNQTDPVKVHDGKALLDLYVDSKPAQSRLQLGEVPLPYGGAVYITDGGELIARGQIESECLYGDQFGIVVRFANRQEAERCAARLWGEDSWDALIERSSVILPAAL